MDRVDIIDMNMSKTVVIHTLLSYFQSTETNDKGT